MHSPKRKFIDYLKIIYVLSTLKIKVLQKNHLKKYIDKNKMKEKLEREKKEMEEEVKSYNGIVFVFLRMIY